MKWLVKIKRGYFMAGIHRFRTKRLAEEFVEAWNKANRVEKYDDLPIVEKANATIH